MGCFPCGGKSNKNGKKQLPITNTSHHQIPSTSEKLKVTSAPNAKKEATTKDGESDNIAVRTFTFRELAAATKNFRADCLLGEGGFGRVYKGRLESTNQVVAIKQLDRNGLQGNREFLVERLLVYEYMPLGSLEDHLHDLPPDRRPLDWNTRMKIAAGAAKGLEYLHDKANPPVIYRDLKCSNILLGEGYHPKLSDFGLAKLGPVGDQTHVSTRVMGTYGYCAPEYAMTGQLTLKSDVYSFGVVLLEIITGRKAIDNSRTGGEQNLVAWARPLFKDRRNFAQMADPLLQGQYPVRGLYQALAVAAMCVQEQPNMRPLIADVVTALTYLASQKYDPETRSVQGPRTGLYVLRFYGRATIDSGVLQVKMAVTTFILTSPCLMRTEKSMANKFRYRLQLRSGSCTCENKMKHQIWLKKVQSGHVKAEDMGLPAG
ncbi:hypothetical protein V6N11_055454 [Hibiscus sabdariffa]|uniref:Protein kinase domain-containing protein n=1 Tax=Hibiscus sabdariffa TaxID=183260 RepID=A0ABR2PFA9_9ROSI